MKMRYVYTKTPHKRRLVELNLAEVTRISIMAIWFNYTYVLGWASWLSISELLWPLNVAASAL